MSWRSSFGATVLLALVAIQSSESVDRPPIPNDNPDASERQGSPIEDALLPRNNNQEDDLVKRVISGHEDASKCRHGEEVAMTGPVGEPQFRELIFNAIMNRREKQNSRVEMEIQSELGAMSESTREHFKLFAELDRRECGSAPGSLCFIFGTLNLVIGKLRRLAGSPKAAEADQLEVEKGFVSACKEVAGHDRLAAIRAKYEEVSPLSTQPYFPHIRFYDYCRRLFDFDSLSAEIDCALESAEHIKRFGQELDKILVHGRHRADPEARWSETAANGERESSVAEAAVRFIVWYTEEKCLVERGLRRLRDECLSVLDHEGNLIWMHQHMYDLMGLERGGHQTRRTERSFRYLEACKQLGELEDYEEISKEAGVRVASKAAKKRKP
jgi:hypothetical protein